MGWRGRGGSSFLLVLIPFLLLLIFVLPPLCEEAGWVHCFTTLSWKYPKWFYFVNQVGFVCYVRYLWWWRCWCWWWIATGDDGDDGCLIGCVQWFAHKDTFPRLQLQSLFQHGWNVFRGFNSSQLFMLHVTITAIATWSGLFNRALCNNVTRLTLEHCHATVSPIASLTQHSVVPSSTQ